MAAAAHERPVEPPLDELTLRRAQKGDERAWRDLIARYERPVHALIWRLFAGRARHRVEDLTQETLVRVLRALPRFDPSGPASLSTWILTIATRMTLNELRRPEHAELSEEPPARERTDAGSCCRLRLARMKLTRRESNGCWLSPPNALSPT